MIVLAALISFSSIANAVSIKSQIKAQTEWGSESLNTFNWNETSKYVWNVINTFYDVQAGPDGALYAV